MFNLQPQTILTTAGIGVVIGILSGYFYYLFVRLLWRNALNEKTFSTWFKSTMRKEYGTNSGQGIVLAVLLYGLGVLAQDMTGQSKDSDVNVPLVTKPLIALHLIRTEAQMRREALLNPDGSFNFLAQEIVNDTALTNRAKQHPLRSPSQLDNPAYLNALYFTANNFLLFQNPSVRDDLVKVQERISFCRSLVHIGFYSFVLLILVYCLYLAKELSENKGEAFLVEMKNAYGELVPVKRIYILRRSWLIVPATIIAAYALLQAETTYNEKVFGSFNSITKQEAHKAPK